MSVAVIIYAFKGKYTGNAEYEYNHPEMGATHDCMLFFRQESEEPEWGIAGNECSKYGFTDVAFKSAGALQVEVLNTDLYRGFAGFYEDALSAGSALVYYPN